jgi:hypothetical protein
MSQFENKMTPNGYWSTISGPSTSVGLSIVPNFTSHISVKIYRNNEGLVTFKTAKSEKSKTIPPIRKSKLSSTQLTNRAKSLIKKCCRIFSSVAKEKSGRKMCTMITLSYPNNFPDDRESKKHLDHFMKRIIRKYPQFVYLWVAEKQKRGAIHYHIITTDFIPKKLINTCWGEIVKKWCDKKGFEFKTVLPNIKGVESPEKYITKYLLKDDINRIEGNRYFISKTAKKLLEPIDMAVVPIFNKSPDQIMAEAKYNLKIDYIILDNSKKIKPGERFIVFGYFVKNAEHLIEYIQYDYRIQSDQYYNQKNDKNESN